MTTYEHEHETPPEPRRSYRQGDALRDALAALAARTFSKPYIGIKRGETDGYELDVRITHDDPLEAERVADEIMARLAAKYPPRADDPEPLKETLTRNSKGETQIAVEGRGDVQARYESLTARYPSASGKVTNDLPPAKAKS